MRKRKRKIIFIIFSFLVLGATLSFAFLLNGVTPKGIRVYLGDPNAIPAIVQKFYSTRDLTTEEGKIDYLIERIRSSKLTFIRNGVESTSQDTAKFMHWKIGWYERRYHTKIKTAQDFVSLVTSGSKTTGQPYTIVLNNSTRHNAQSVLQNELDALEFYLKEYLQDQEVNADRSVERHDRNL